MAADNPAITQALREQLDAWRAELSRGSQRVGWKIGFNIPEIQQRLGLREPVVGHLTSATQLDGGGEYLAADAVALRAEAEIAVRVGEGLTAETFAPAIEIVDVGRPPEGAAGIVAGNIFHRAFVLGDESSSPPEALSLTIGGREVLADQPVPDFAATIEIVSRNLRAAGAELEPGDWIIAGALAHDAVAPGETVTVAGGDGPPLTLTISAAAA